MEVKTQYNSLTKTIAHVHYIDCTCYAHNYDYKSTLTNE